MSSIVIMTRIRQSMTHVPKLLLKLTMTVTRQACTTWHAQLRYSNISHELFSNPKALLLWPSVIVSYPDLPRPREREISLFILRQSEIWYEFRSATYSVLEPADEGRFTVENVTWACVCIPCKSFLTRKKLEIRKNAFNFDILRHRKSQ